MKLTIKKLRNRMACGVLAIALTFGLTPAMAFADDGVVEQSKDLQVQIERSAFEVSQADGLGSINALAALDSLNPRADYYYSDYSYVKQNTVKTLKLNKNYTLKVKKGTSSKVIRAFYKFTLTKPGKLTIKSSGISNKNALDLMCLEKSLKRVIAMEYDFQLKKVTSYYLEAGTYYVRAFNKGAADTFKIRLRYAKVASNFKDGIENKYNDSNNAPKISFNKTYRAVIGSHCSLYNTDRCDMYKFTVPASGTVKFTYKPSTKVKGTFMGIWSSYGYYFDGSRVEPGKSNSVYLTEGTWYLVMMNNSTAASDGKRVAGGTYNFKITYKKDPYGGSAG